MQVEEQQALQARVAQLEKRLKTAESQCQAATKEIWQMEVEVARLEEKLQEAEARSTGGPDLELLSRLDQAESESVRLRELLEGAADREELEQAQLEVNRLRQQLDFGSEWELRLQSAEERYQQARSELEQLQLTQQANLSEIEQLRHSLEQAQARQALDETTAIWEERLEETERRALRAESELEAQTERLDELENLRHELVGLQHRLEGSEELRNQLEHLQGRLADSEQRCQQLTAELSELGQTSGSNSDLSRLQDNLNLYQEKASLLQQRLEQLQQRLELSEEKGSIYQAKADEAGQKVLELSSRAQQAEEEARLLRDRLERMETRVRDADRVFEAAETQMREAERRQNEAAQKIRDAETRANQALVENKKLSDKISDHERRAQESDRETQRLAFQDPLTGLPNINLITQYLEFSCKQCVRYRRVAALLVVDIDRFKVFNEAMGSKAGDDLLGKVAERLQQAIRDTDSLGRRGEDEFIILLSELNVGEHNHPEGRIRAIRQHVEVVANRVMQMMAPPFTVQGQKFYLHVSVGIAICPDDGETPQSLLENADTAMYHVKETGRNRHQFYTADLRRQQEKRLTLDMQMRSALDRNEFEVRYHPVISLAKGKGTLVGVEALLRWNHRIDGTVGPDYFLSAAEESGMIVPIGQWVLNQTCTRMREWLGQGLRIFASVNLSKRQLLQADLVDVIGRELSQNGIPPEVLYVEIAEGFNTFNPEHMDQVINRLGQAGIRVAIDDFGVGYSSLSRVNLAYTRVLKIDRSIIDKCPNDRQSSTVCIAAINLASSLGLLSLAEGVENLNQVRFLTKYGCALAQGYYFSEPVLPAEITNFHRSKKVWKL